MDKKLQQISVNDSDGELFSSTMSVMDGLCSLLEDEILAVKKQDHAALQELMRRKAKLVISHQANVKCIANPDIAKRISPELRTRMRSLGEKLAAVGERNSLALKSAAGAVQLLINGVVEKAKEQSLPKQGYRDTRCGLHYRNPYSPTCEPVAVVRTA